MAAEPTRLEHYLDMVRPRLPHALVSDEMFAQVRAIASHFPALPLVGFETHLGSPDPTVDLFLLLDNCTADIEFPRRADPVGRLPANAEDDPAWRRVIEACRAFRARSTPLMRAVTSIWLEFDSVPGQPALPLPSIFMGIRDLRATWSGPSLATAYAGGLEELIRLLTGRPPAPGVVSQVRAIVDRTSADAAGYHVGAMLSRAGDAVRLCARHTPAPAIISQLQALGWTGSDDPAGAFARYFELVPEPTVHVDIGDRIGPRLGFDLPLARSFVEGQPRDEPRWREMLAHLVSDGLAGAAKCDALFTWPGGARLVPDTAGGDAAPTTYLIRGLNHVKVVTDGRGGRSAKGYFAYQHLEPLEDPTRGVAATANRERNP